MCGRFSKSERPERLADDVDLWLDSDAPPEALASLLQPAPDHAVRIWQVATAVNSVRNDGPHLLEPLAVVG